jgi:aerobic-type carbon monoxide dehydrogenase small subunit (CoxS/CutS family)
MILEVMEFYPFRSGGPTLETAAGLLLERGPLQKAGVTLGPLMRAMAALPALWWESSMQRAFTFTVNGKSQSVTTDPARPLLDVLREDLGVMGAKFGCGERQCGACTVLVNGRPAFSCSTRIATINNRTVETIEGLSDGETLHPLQEAFLAEGAFQCGYCTTGMIMNAVALLRDKPKPTPAEIRAAMDRNMCRCGTHLRIMRAVELAAASGGRES